MSSARVRCAAMVAALAATALVQGCYTGSAHDVSARQIESDPAWQMVRDVPFVAQKSDTDCGAAALAMVLGFWGVSASLEEITRLAPPEGGGIRAGALRDLARRNGLEAYLVEGTLVDIVDQVGRGRPVLVGLAKPLLSGRAVAHYEVIVGVNRSRRRVLSLDPAHGLMENSFEGFVREWVPARQVTVIVFKPGPAATPAPDV